MSFIRLAFVCLLSLFLAVSVWAQDKSLNDAKTGADCWAYITQEIYRFKLNNLGAKQRAVALADVYTAAGEKIIQLAATPGEKLWGYHAKLQALMLLVEADVENAEQKLETFLKEIYTDKVLGEARRTGDGGIDGRILELRTFASRPLYYKKMTRAEATPEIYEKFKSDIKTDIGGRYFQIALFDAIPFWLRVAERHNVPAKQFLNEWIEFMQSPECRVEGFEKEQGVTTLKFILRFFPGTELKLKGKTLDNEDFNLESLRGKYVWVKFTATWCGPCNLAIPGMREAYERYHDKGFEIVSVYISQNEQDPVATVRKHVEEKKIPWIILSEELSKKAGQPGYWDEYSPRGVPTMMLLDKEGKIMTLPTHGSDSGKLIAKLAEIFE